ncbi:MAG: hypothetical protein RR986_07450 [Longicatena sp.]
MQNLYVSRIEVVVIEDEYLLLSKYISGVYDEHENNTQRDTKKIYLE